MGRPVHWTTPNSIPDLYLLLDASSTPPVLTTKNVSRHGQMSPGATLPPAENHWSDLTAAILFPILPASLTATSSQATQQW